MKQIWSVRVGLNETYSASVPVGARFLHAELPDLSSARLYFEINPDAERVGSSYRAYAAGDRVEDGHVYLGAAKGVNRFGEYTLFIYEVTETLDESMIPIDPAPVRRVVAA